MTSTDYAMTADAPARPLRARTLLAAMLLVLIATLLPDGSAVGDVNADPDRSDHLLGQAEGSDAEGAQDEAPSAPSDGTADEVRRDGPTPLMIVLDVSGSMNEADDDGQVRLDVAKSGLADVLFEQQPGSPVGVWTYPDQEGDGCSDGALVQPIGPLDATEATARIETFGAGGQTPTGPALKAAVDALRQAGYSEGNLLLVSDGLSNCPPDPCEVAGDLVSEGFNLTIDTFGMYLSDEGLQELQCIASATGGRSYEADDTDQVEELLDDLARTSLDVEVDVAPLVTSGLSTPIDVTVTNDSGVDAEDVQVSLAFREVGSDSIMPAVLPPRYRVGNIPAGEAVERRWDVVPGGSGDEGRAEFEVTASATRGASTTTSGAFDISGEHAGIDDAGELLSDVRDAGGRIAIMGDSFSSGEGVGTYLEGTSTPENRCHRSHLTYAVPLYGEDRTRIIACSGAVTEDFFTSQEERADTPAQRIQLRAMDPAPDLVLLTLGGNDIGFSSIATRCVRWDDCTSDFEFVQDAYDDIGLLQSQLERTYRAVSDELYHGGNEDGTVLVLAYPQLLPDEEWASCRGFNANEVRFANTLVRQLNGVIEQAVENVHRQGHDVRFVRQAQQAVLPSNTACDPEPYVNPADLLIGAGALGTDVREDWGFPGENPARVQELLHPNELGYRAMTNSLVRWSQTTPGEAPEATPVRSDPPQLEVDDSPPEVIDLRVEDSSTPLRQGQRLEVVADGYAPGTEVILRVRSEPVTLASVRVDDEGGVRARASVPEHTPRGRHALEVAGFDTDGSYQRLTHPVAIRAPRPLWLWPVGLAGMVSVLIGAGVWLRVRRSVRRARTSDSGH